MGPVAALVLVALVRTIREPRGRAAGALLGLSSLLGLLHYSTVGVAALGVATSVWAFARGASRRSLGVGLGLSLVLAAPFVAGELGSGFETTRSVLGVAAHGGRASHDALAPERARLAFPREALATLDLERFARALGSGESWVRALGPPHALLLGLGVALGLLVLGGACLGARELWRALSRRERLGTTGIALALGLAAWAPFFALRLPTRAHYVQGAFPALALLAGVALERAARRGGRAGASLAATFLLVLGVAGVLEVAAVLRAVDAGHSEPGSAYELPFRDKKAACELVLDEELELVGYRRFEDQLLIAECFRQLERRDPARARRFELVGLRQPYWELDYVLPRPRRQDPGSRVELVAAPGPELLEGEVGRRGVIVVKRVP